MNGFFDKTNFTLFLIFDFYSSVTTSIDFVAVTVVTPLLFLEMEARHKTISKIRAFRWKSSGPLRISHDRKLLTEAPPPTRWTVVGGYPKVASYDMLAE